MTQTHFTIQAIGFVESSYKEKFATPRQPGLVPQAKGKITLLPPYNDPDCVAGLEQASHVWLEFMFHQNLQQGWKAKVRPPRLGGNDKMGIFATRATHRPNGMGLSVVSLDNIAVENGGSVLYVSGLDLIDGTPIIDIKPYVPYSDALEHAQYPFAQHAPKTLTVQFAQELIEHLPQPTRVFIEQVLQQDPKPAFHQFDPERIYGAKLENYNVTWSYRQQNNATVIFVEAATLLAE